MFPYFTVEQFIDIVESFLKTLCLLPWFQHWITVCSSPVLMWTNTKKPKIDNLIKKKKNRGGGGGEERREKRTKVVEAL